MTVETIERPSQEEDSLEFGSSGLSEAVGPLFTMIKKIIDYGKKYDLIIGDDTEGRLPTLVVRNVLSQIGDEIPTRFICGSRFIRRTEPEITANELREVLKRLDEKPDRVLVVTDFIDTGGTYRTIGEFLNQVGVNFDVAALASKQEESYRRFFDLGMKRETQYFFGQIGRYPFPGDSEYTGLRRNSKFSDRVNRNPLDRRKIKSAQEDVKKISSWLVKEIKTSTS